MSRLSRYRESLTRFIRNKSGLSKTAESGGVDSLAYDYIKSSDLILPILVLTIMNNQNKKKKVTLHGYHAAACIAFCQTILTVVEDKSNFVKQYGIDHYHKLITHLIVSANRSLSENIQSIRHHIKATESIDVFLNSMEILNERLTYVKLLSNIEPTLTSRRPLSEIQKWIITNSPEMTEKVKSIKVIERKCFRKYMENHIGSLCELTFALGWLTGCGGVDSLDSITKASEYFATMYKISLDFSRIQTDIAAANNYSFNFVINYGFQKSYELFMESKEKFIKEAMTTDIYTATVKEIHNYVEHRVDELLENTTPDLKSNYSNMYSLSLND